MKKVLTLLFGLVLLTGCCVDSNTELRPASKIIMSGEPKVFKFNGHEYIYFYTSYGDIVHNPDCPCTKKDEYSIY